MKRRTVVVISLTVLLVGYAVGPLIAGANRIGDRFGPAIYPTPFHETLYILAHEGAYKEKPRVPLDAWMYRRPLFYGLSRRLKSSEERSEFLEMIRRNESPMLKHHEHLNRQIEGKGQETKAFRKE